MTDDPRLAHFRALVAPAIVVSVVAETACNSCKTAFQTRMRFGLDVGYDRFGGPVVAAEIQENTCPRCRLGGRP